MLTSYVLRGVKAGVAGGIALGAFVAFVGNPLIAYAETFESGGHGGGPVVSSAVTSSVSIVGGLLLGILVGAVVYGALFYFLEPAIPGRRETKSYLLGAAGFITLSGGPWLVLPPQPPGIEQGLPTRVRIAWYLILMLVAALACGLAGYVFHRARQLTSRRLAAIAGLVPFLLVVATAGVSPANPVSGPIPDQLATVFRTVTAMGQIGFWFVLASSHAWLLGRERAPKSNPDDPRPVGRATGSMTAD